MGNEPKGQHLLPKFYLRGFSQDDKIGVCRFGEPPKRFESSINKVAVENDFYTAKWLPEGERYSIENLLSRIEGRAAAGFKQVCADYRKLSIEHRDAIALWITVQYLRGRGKRFDSVELQKFLLRMELALRGPENLGKALGHSDPKDTEAAWERYVTRGELGDPPNATWHHMRTMFSLATKIAPYYAASRWVLVYFERRSLFTSDQPISLWRQPDSSGDRSIGMLTADIVSVPLTRKVGLVILPGEIDQEILLEQATTRVSKFFNVNTFLNAEEMLLHHPADELPEWASAPGVGSLGTMQLPDFSEVASLAEQVRRNHKQGSSEP